MITAREALERLREGNRRFVSEDWSTQTLPSTTRRRELASGQAPFAIILGCSDSRVPAEIIFDQGLGDLFVIRGRYLRGEYSAPHIAPFSPGGRPSGPHRASEPQVAAVAPES